MFRNIKNKLHNSFPQNQKPNKTNTSFKMSKDLDKNIEMFKDIFLDDDTIRFRRYSNDETGLSFCVIYIENMVDKDTISSLLVKPLLDLSKEDISKGDSLSDIVITTVQVVDQIKHCYSVNQGISDVLSGKTLLIVDKYDAMISVDNTLFNYRAITEPVTESVVRGPREGFNEVLGQNLVMIRRKIKSPNLKFKMRELGTRTKTSICLCYIDDIVDKNVLKEVNTRLDSIDIDGILESGYIEELIKDNPYSPFSTIGHHERPDIIAADLLEGRVAIAIDGAPAVLTIPYLFIEYFQSNEDYYDNFIYSTFNRMIRIVGFFIASSIPAVYVALTTFHQEMIPTPLLLSISASREGVPFPTIIEALFLVLIFDLLRESGVRLPTPVGSTIGFVGAVILGQSAVNAKFVSAPIVIVAAITGISNFLVPHMVGPLIVIRLIFLGLSAILGLYGYIFGVIALFIHLMSLKSFGYPYMMDIGSLQPQDIKDTAIRAPWWKMINRPKFIAKNNEVRQQNNVKRK